MKNRLRDAGERSRVAAHVASCELCTEFCEAYHQEFEAISGLLDRELPFAAQEVRDKVFARSVRGLVIDLDPMVLAAKSPIRMAADGLEARLEIEHLATLYSESPEAVLRIMRDNKAGRDYLQLMSDSAELVSHVMIRLPDLGREYITDDDGVSVIDPPLDGNLGDLKWQIKLPDAVFSLEKLDYDPNTTLHSNQVELSTPGSDRIRVTLQSKEDGKNIVVEVLELDGQSDFGEVRVMISKPGYLRSHPATPQSRLSFDIADPSESISIRLYR